MSFHPLGRLSVERAGLDERCKKQGVFRIILRGPYLKRILVLFLFLEFRIFKKMWLI